MKYTIPSETWINPKIVVRETSSGKGKGMFATESIKDGERVMVWGGIWGKDYVDKIGAEKAKKEGYQIMQWGDNLYSVEIPGDSLGYFINHSCDLNAWMVDAFTHVARRNIKKGEEITTDYALMEADENFIAKWECKCGSHLCRHKFTGKDWKQPELQKRYKGHFSPLINKRIVQTK